MPSFLRKAALSGSRPRKALSISSASTDPPLSNTLLAVGHSYFRVGDAFFLEPREHVVTEHFGPHVPVIGGVVTTHEMAERRQGKGALVEGNEAKRAPSRRTTSRSISGSEPCIV